MYSFSSSAKLSTLWFLLCSLEWRNLRFGQDCSESQGLDEGIGGVGDGTECDWLSALKSVDFHIYSDCIRRGWEAISTGYCWYQSINRRRINGRKRSSLFGFKWNMFWIDWNLRQVLPYAQVSGSSSVSGDLHPKLLFCTSSLVWLIRSIIKWIIYWMDSRLTDNRF